MICLRQVLEKDLDGLEALSKIAAERHPGFLNMPLDRDAWKERIHRSMESFSDRIVNKKDAKYIFVAHDLSTNRLLGTSMVSAQHGTPETPHFYFEVGSEQKLSQSINMGFIHGTLKFRYDTDGPTEIGGLLVDPDSRNRPDKVGRQISFVRFLYMGMHRNRFKRRILAELLPPLTKKGKSPLWEAVGRRFTNMDYSEADELSAKNKEFIFSLFPTEKIYVTFLPADAKNSIGKVSKDTEPVLHMLQKIGFKYVNHVDPFDGGPHVYANIDEILPIRHMIHKPATIVQQGVKFEGDTEHGLVTPSAGKQFVSVATQVQVTAGKILLPPDVAAALSVSEGDPVHFMPFYSNPTKETAQ
jgi:arginine N-succinyltransferase